MLALSAPVAASAPPVVQAQAGRASDRDAALDPAVEFLAPWGVGSFAPHEVRALSALLRAQAKYDAGSYAGAKRVLDAIWAEHPTGGVDWGQLPMQPFGINIGSPPCYYALRMLSDATDWRVATPGSAAPLRTATLTVVLVGRSHGIEPQSLADLQLGTGIPVDHVLEPLLLEDGNRVVHESLHLLREYVLAMTGGDLGLDVQILHLPDVDLEVSASISGGRKFAGLSDLTELWPFLTQAQIAATDWWWVLYPSHVPEHIPGWENAEFVTGGMGTGPDATAPCFLIDDRWLVRKPPHLGDGPYSDVERNAYLPQWLQHELFHHLFRTYPEFGLEQTPHQWFDLGTWPPDFEGRYEADYFHEALYRRLQGARPPLVAKLRYATAGAPWQLFTVADLLGPYRRSPVENDWHVGDIQLSPQLEWQNQAGVDWNLQDDLANGRLLLGPDCPYWGNGWHGRKFDVVLARDDLGDLQPEIAGFAFLGELYAVDGP